MSEILITATFIVLLVGAFAGLVVWVRRDTFTGEQYRLPTRPAKSPTYKQPKISAPAIRTGVLHLN